MSNIFKDKGSFVRSILTIASISVVLLLLSSNFSLALTTNSNISIGGIRDVSNQGSLTDSHSVIPPGYSNTTIAINGNAQLAASKFVVSGNGSASSPFIISGLKIYDNGTISISISTINLYLIIRNISILMNDLPVNSSATEMGIYLFNDSNIKIENVTAFSLYPQPIRKNPSNGEPEGVSTFLNIFYSENIDAADCQISNTSSGISASNSDNLTFEHVNMTNISGDRPFFTYEVNSSSFISNTLNSYDNNYMFQSWKGKNDTFSGNTGNYASGDSIWAYELNNSTIVNNTFSNCPLQSILETSGQNDTISGNTVFNVSQAIILDGGANITVNYNKLYHDTSGIGLDGYSHRVVDSRIYSNLVYNTSTAITSGFGNYGNIVRGNTINGSQQAILFSDSPDNIISSNFVFGNSVGVSLQSSPGNLVYNNYFSNHENAYSDSTDTWNITPYSGLNILGGDVMAGNYWSNYYGKGNNGVGQSSLPYNNNGNIQYGGDSTPLVLNTSFSVALGDVNATYRAEIYVPVYLTEGSTFVNISQTISFNSNLLSFEGIENTLSSYSSQFTYNELNTNTVSISGSGVFEFFGNVTVLFYLEFSSIAGNYTTNITNDYAAINETNNISLTNGELNISNGWTNIGPSNINYLTGQYGAGEDLSFQVARSDPKIMYTSSGITGVYSFGGFFYSTDGGEKWYPSDMGLYGTAVQSIAISPYDPYEVVIITNDFLEQGGGVYKSMNGGHTWQETYSQGGNELYVSQNGTLYAVTFTQILVSYDFGNSWKGMSPVIDGTIFTATFLDNATYIEIGISAPINAPPYSKTEVLVSNNGGRSFTNVFQYQGGPIMMNIAVDPANEDNQFLDMFPGYYKTNESLYFSSNKGLNWTVVDPSSIGLSISSIISFQYVSWDPYNQSIVFLGGEGQAMSVNGGKTFRVLSVPGDVRFIEFSPVNKATVYEGSDQGLSVSHNLGTTWSYMNNRSSSLLYGAVADGGNIFTTAQDYAPVYYNGTEWIAGNSGNASFQGVGEGGIVAVDPYNSSVIILENGFLLESRDGGDNFTKLSIVPGWTASQAGGIMFHPNGTIFVPGNEGIYVTHDYGQSWSLLNNSPVEAYSLASDPENSTVLYASNASGLFMSRNGGSSWVLQNKIPFTSIVALNNGKGIMATKLFQGMGMYISENNGISFQYANISSASFPFVPPNTGGVYSYYINQKQIVVFVSNNGIYFTQNYGRTWIGLNDNIRVKEVTSFYYSPNGTGYISTYGAGVYYEKELFNQVQVSENPQLTVFLPVNSTLLLDNKTVDNSAGYFTVELPAGEHYLSFIFRGHWYNKTIVIMNNSPYFYNFSQLFKNYPVTFTESGLPPGNQWTILINDTVYYFNGKVGAINLLPGTYNISFEPAFSDYSIYYPLSRNVLVSISYSSISLNITFKEEERVSQYNVTSEMKGMFWSTQAAYNMGYILYAGGTLGLLNITSKEGTILTVPDYAGIADTVVPFLNGFLIAGSASPNRPGVYYYDIQTGLFTNYSSVLPSSWNASSSNIQSVFAINGSAFGFIGGGVGTAYFGVVEDGRFLNFTQYLPSSFTPTKGSYDSYYASYIPNSKGVLVSDGSDIGMFYLVNKTFQDLSNMMPNGFNVGPSSTRAWGYDYIASNGSSAIICGSDNNEPMTLLFDPGHGVRDISSLFPTTEYMDTVSWYGDHIALSGYNKSGTSPSIFIYNTSTGIPTEVGTGYYGNVSAVDSAIMIGDSIYFSTFKTIPVPNQTYVIFTSYYGEISLVPTGELNIRVNVPSTIEINNWTFTGSNLGIFEFTGNYTLTVSALGYKTYSTSVYVPPLGSVNLSILLSPAETYNLTFTESGLPSGTSWTVTLNGTVASSTSSSITFSEPNGTYSYAVTNAMGYSVLPSSGTVSVTGNSISESITFSQLIDKGYFEGSVSPPNATISIFINGSWVSHTEINGSFNISLNPGTYRVSITAPGYATYTMNVTIIASHAMHFSGNLVQGTQPPGTPLLEIVIIAAVVIIAVAAATVAIVLRKRKR